MQDNIATLEDRWHGIPQKKIQNNNIEILWRPPSYIFLTEAINFLGGKYYEGKWSGEECRARQLSGDTNEFNIFGYRACRELTEIHRCDTVIGYEVITSEGLKKVSNAKEALLLWKKEKPKLEDLLLRERISRERFDYIVKLLRDLLYSGNIVAFIKNKEGECVEVPVESWGKENASNVFELHESENPNYMKVIKHSSHTYIEGSVLLKLSDVEGYNIHSSIPYRDLICKASNWMKKEVKTGSDHGKKDDWFKIMKNLFPRLSRAQFDKVWSNDASDEMKSSGPRKKL